MIGMDSPDVSAYTTADGGHAPRGGVRRAADFSQPYIRWRKSMASDSGGCLEVAVVDGSVLVRDSKNRDGAMLRFAPKAWSVFLVHARGMDPGLRRT